MNRKILFSLISIVVTLSLVGGATYAYFSSTATSTGNVFGSGTLVLQLDDNDQATPASTVTASIGGSDLVPGGSVSGFISMHNGGSIAINKVKLSATQTSSSSPDLATVLTFTTVKVGDDPTCETGATDITTAFTSAIGGTHLSNLNGTTYNALPGLAVSATKYLCMTFTMDSSADDNFQGKSITETFSFFGAQDASQ